MGTVGTAVAIAAIAYLVGSIPSAYIVGRLVSGVDMRVAGEGNFGARNSYHVVGHGWGVACACSTRQRAARWRWRCTTAPPGS